MTTIGLTTIGLQELSLPTLSIPTCGREIMTEETIKGTCYKGSDGLAYECQEGLYLLA